MRKHLPAQRRTISANYTACRRARRLGMRLAILSIALSIGALFGATSAQADRKIMTYQEATAAGIDVGPTPSEAGMPACSMTGDPGFASSGEADAKMDEIDKLYGEDGPVKRCLADPTKVTFIIEDNPVPKDTDGKDTPDLDPFLRWAGAETLERLQGGRAGIEDGDPDVPHPCDETDASYAARVIATTPVGNSLEAGWLEDCRFASWRNQQLVYWGYWLNGHFLEADLDYSLTWRGYYLFRVRQFGNPGVNDVVAELWYNNQWNVLTRRFGMQCQTSTRNNCLLEFAGEADANYGGWPWVDAPVDGEGVNFRNVRVRTAQDVWPHFNSGSFAGRPISDPPYSYCGILDWRFFRVPYGGC